MSWDDAEKALDRLSHSRLPHWDGYLGFYSSWLGGFFREPWLMMMPFDDHGFHRGDGVFEAVRIIDRAYFDLDSHLERLKNSAAAIGMELPKPLAEVKSICVRLASLCDAEQGILRLYITRGPGGFSPSVREVVGHQIYAAITIASPPKEKSFERGVRAMLSHVQAKDPFWSKIKSCNYLQNVLMKKECLERGFDFAISVNNDGLLCEGSTENMMIVNAAGEMIVPRFDYTLRGTTVRVTMKLAEQLVREGLLKSVALGDVHREDLLRAREAAFVGTTLTVLPMTSLDDVSIGDGRPGVVSKRLREMLVNVMRTSAEYRTAF